MPTDSGTPSSPFLERKLSTILSADVAEFSRLMSEDEEQALRTFRGHKKIFEALVATHRGRVFNTAGDAILAEFPSAVEAVRYATDIQSALRTREVRRCFHGLGVVRGNQIKGQWPMGQDTGVTMFLRGEVSTEGDIKMEMHSERSDGSRIITANFTGWVHDRQFDAQGKLRMGRPATIHWHKSTQVPGAN